MMAISRIIAVDRKGFERRGLCRYLPSPVPHPRKAGLESWVPRSLATMK